MILIMKKSYCFSGTLKNIAKIIKIATIAPIDNNIAVYNVFFVQFLDL